MTRCIQRSKKKKKKRLQLRMGKLIAFQDLGHTYKNKVTISMVEKRLHIR